MYGLEDVRDFHPDFTMPFDDKLNPTAADFALLSPSISGDYLTDLTDCQLTDYEHFQDLGIEATKPEVRYEYYSLVHQCCLVSNLLQILLVHAIYIYVA